MNLQRKLFLVNSVPLLIVFVTLLFLTEYMVKNIIEDNAFELAVSIAETNQARIEGSLNELYVVATEQANQIASVDEEYHNAASREMTIGIFEDALKAHGIFGGAVYLLPNIIGDNTPEAEHHLSRLPDGTYHKVVTATKRTDASWYNDVIINRKVALSEPHFYDVRTQKHIFDAPTQEQIDSKTLERVAILTVPIVLADGRIGGAVSLDLLLTRFQDIIAGVKPFGTGYAVLMSNSGIIMSSPNESIIGTDYRTITYMSGVLPTDVINAYSSGKTLVENWHNTSTSKNMGMVVLPIELADIKPLGLAVGFAINDAYKEVEMPKMLFVSRLILAFIVVIIMCTYLITKRSIIRYLNQFMEALKDLTEGDGDLTKQIIIKTGDEFEVLAGYLNKFVLNLRTLVRDVKTAADEVASGNNQLAATMEELSTTFSSQSEQVSTVARNMDTINDSSKIIVESLALNVKKMDDAKQSMIEGSDQLNVAVGNMNLIKEKNKSLSVTVGDLAESSSKIGDILGVINDIADQTNLLALNAAIEAARAGDAGRGFAVVADEVRKLAERTQSSTSEIASIISSLQKETTAASTEMANSSESVEEGLQNINKTDEVFKTVVEVVGEIDATTREVNGGISDQFHMVQDINDSTQGIAAGIEESVHAVNEVSSTVAHLQNRAEVLKNLTSKFKVD